MGCKASTASKDASLSHENSRLRAELARKDAEISRLLLSQTTGKNEQTAPSTENLQHFLNKTVPDAHRWLETVKRHSTCKVDVLLQKLGELQRDASKVKETAEKYQSHVDEHAKGLRDEANDVKLQISDIEKRLDLSKWFVEDVVALLSYEFKVLKAEKLRAWKGGPLPKHQELMEVLGAGSLTSVRISIRDLVSDSALLKSILVISHRWVKPGLPDPEGKQQAIIVEHLKSHPEIQYVWEDWWCIPQGRRTEKEQDYFDKTLEHVYMLFLGAQVLLLPDMQYLGRFWTSYETWLSMRFVSQDGFSHADDRVTIRCLGAAGAMEQSLKDTWGPLDITQAHANLSLDDITVTNQRDKDQQLKVLQQLARDLPALISLLSQVGVKLECTSLGGQTDSWASSNQGPMIQLKDKRTATSTVMAPGHTWNTVYGTKQISKGKCCWRVKIVKADRCGGNSWQMIVGVSSSLNNQGNFLSSGEAGFGYVQLDGRKTKGHASEPYAEPYSAGDIISIVLNMNKLTLRFEKNKRDMGESHTVPAGKYNLAVSLGASGHVVQLL